MSTIGTIDVGNLKKTKKGMRCDRGTIYGNPFEMKDEAYRDKVCDAHKKYLWLVMAHGYSQKNAAIKVAREMGLGVSPKMKTSESFSDSVNVLSSQVRSGKSYLLLCWCHPKRCHCNNLKDLILYLAREEGSCVPSSSTA